jgi:hypothetical protein
LDITGFPVTTDKAEPDEILPEIAGKKLVRTRTKCIVGAGFFMVWIFFSKQICQLKLISIRLAGAILQQK